jgi:hypothetical protein
LTPAASELSVLVNSTDSYHDCWEPFFTLFSRYWPTCQLPVLLNTEQLAFQHDAVDVRATRVAGLTTIANPTWSQSLHLALEECPTDLVLYLQEDYFLQSPVRADLIGGLVERMRASRSGGGRPIDCVRLLDCPDAGPWMERDDDVWPVAPHAFYRVTLQAAIWDRAALSSLLRRHESPWQFEIRGSRRASARQYNICSVNRNRFGPSGSMVMDYVPTGIVRGRWMQPIVEPLFEREGIEVDFETRGFFLEGAAVAPATPLTERSISRLRSSPRWPGARCSGSSCVGPTFPTS